MSTVRGTPFHRAREMFAALAMARTAAEFHAMAMSLKQYESRGKGGHRACITDHGVAKTRRAAAKARNIQKHGKATR